MNKIKMMVAAVLIGVAGFSVPSLADSRIGSAMNSVNIQINENLAEPVTYYGYGRGYGYRGYRGYRRGYGRGYRRNYGGYGRGYRSRRNYGGGYGYRGYYGGYSRGYRGYYGGYGRRGY